MANNKLVYEVEGKIKEISSSYIDTTNNKLVTNNLSASSISIDGANGLLSVENNTIKIIPATTNGNLVISDGTKWVSSYASSSQSTVGTPESGDLDGTYPNPIVTNLSNVTNGTLPLSRGGTGLSSLPSVGELLILGNGTNIPSIISSLSGTNDQYLYYDGQKWSFTSQAAETSASVVVDIYTNTGSFTWTKPAGTKFIRVLAQGGGGGGGAGYNKTGTANGFGGGGGGAGGFVDVISAVESSVTTGTVLVGSGGIGQILQAQNTITGTGDNGGDSSFTIGSITYATAKGGNGGNCGSTVSVAGGVAVSGTSDIKDDYYNTIVINSSNPGGASGVSSTFASSSTSYYGAGGGGGGGNFTGYLAGTGGNGGSAVFNSGSLRSFDGRIAVSSSVKDLLKINPATINPNSQASDLFISSGGGGAAANPPPIFAFNLTESSISTIVNTSPYIQSITGAFGVSSSATMALAPAGLFGSDKYALSGAYSATTAARTAILGNFSYSSANNFSKDCWVYLANVGASGDSVLRSTFMNDDLNDYAIGVGGTANATTGSFGIFDGGASRASNLAFRANEWFHVAMVREGTALRLYVNATASSTTYTPNAGNTGTRTKMYIGTNFTSATYNINGYINGVRFLPYAMTQQEIIDTYLSRSQFSYTDYPSGIGGNGSWGSGGGGGASCIKIGTSTRQGGNGGNGYVAILSYK